MSGLAEGVQRGVGLLGQNRWTNFNLMAAFSLSDAVNIHHTDARVQALQLVELEFQMAVRDQIIADQRNAIGSLWNVLGKLASPERVQEIAAEQGIDMEYAELQLQVSNPTICLVLGAEFAGKGWFCCAALIKTPHRNR